MTVTMDIDVLDTGNWWGGAERTVEKALDAGKGAALEALVEDCFEGTYPSLVSVNDLLRFDGGTLLKELGIEEEED